MNKLQGDGIREFATKSLRNFGSWLKPDKTDSVPVQALKMVYKAIAVLLLIAFSPVLLVILAFAFLAAF